MNTLALTLTGPKPKPDLRALTEFEWAVAHCYRQAQDAVELAEANALTLHSLAVRAARMHPAHAAQIELAAGRAEHIATSARHAIDG